MPANTTAAGKVLLSRLSPAQVELLLGPDPLPIRTPSSISTHAALAAELEVVRARGYALNNSENEQDITAAAAAIPGVHGVRSAAVSVAAPAMRTDPERLAIMSAAAVKAAQRIGARLGGGS